MYPNVHCSVLYRGQDMKATQMSISRGVGNEDVVHICDGISFSRKKEQKWVICRDVDKSRVCHTQ